MTRRLTAQEALDLLGFVPFYADTPQRLGPVENLIDGGILKPGTIVVLVGQLSQREAFSAYRKLGWPHGDPGYFYKAIAE